MNTSERIKLEAWIAENVMGWEWRDTDQEEGWAIKGEGWACEDSFTPEFTTNPAAAMEVLKRCVEKAADAICITQTAKGNYLIDHLEIGTSALTLELAICKFAKILFSK